MAIDSVDKRRSAGSHMVATTYPLADSDVDEGDRAHVAWVYRDFDFDVGIQPRSAGRNLWILEML